MWFARYREHLNFNTSFYQARLLADAVRVSYKPTGQCQVKK